VVKTADFWNLHDLASGRRLDTPRVGGVLVEREMGTEFWRGTGSGRCCCSMSDSLAG